jgi:hypothetical protein
MKQATLRKIALAEVIALPVYVLTFIWRLQFSAPLSWIPFPIWIGASLLMHCDSPKTLGWRADNLWPASKWALICFGVFAVALIAIGLALGQPRELPPNLRSIKQLWTYFAFCLLQQVILNSFLTNRLLSLLRNKWIAAVIAGGVFATCHWPNPVLVPLTFAGGVTMAWLFARNRNIIPLAILQAIIGSIAWWSFPLAWHHRLRVGPAYYYDWK